MKQYVVEAQRWGYAIWEPIYYTDDLESARRYAAMLKAPDVKTTRMVDQSTGKPDQVVHHPTAPQVSPLLGGSHGTTYDRQESNMTTENLRDHMIRRIKAYAPGSSHGGAALLQAARNYRIDDIDDAYALAGLVGQAITYLRSRIETLQAEADRLQRLDPVEATTYYRDGKYLYIHHPTAKNGSKRVREYIGTDPGKQAEALARIQAYNDLQAVQALIRETDHALAAIIGHLSRALLAATGERHW